MHGAQSVCRRAAGGLTPGPGSSRVGHPGPQSNRDKQGGVRSRPARRGQPHPPASTRGVCQLHKPGVCPHLHCFTGASGFCSQQLPRQPVWSGRRRALSPGSQHLVAKPPALGGAQAAEPNRLQTLPGCVAFRNLAALSMFYILKRNRLHLPYKADIRENE